MTHTITLTEGGTATFTGTWPDGNGDKVEVLAGRAPYGETP